MIWDDKGAWGWDTSDCAAFRSFDGTFFMGIDATYDPPPGDHHLLLLPAPPLLPFSRLLSDAGKSLTVWRCRGWSGPYYAISSDYVPAASRFIARATQDYASDDEKTFFSFKEGDYFVITCANTLAHTSLGRLDTPAQRLRWAGCGRLRGGQPVVDGLPTRPAEDCAEDGGLHIRREGRDEALQLNVQLVRPCPPSSSCPLCLDADMV